MINKADSKNTPPRSSLDHWGVLAAVVDQGGFGPAALALHRSQSAVSYAIARLQSALDVALFSHEGRRAVLTAEGEALLNDGTAVVLYTIVLGLAATGTLNWSGAAGVDTEQAIGDRRDVGIHNHGIGLDALAA